MMANKYRVLALGCAVVAALLAGPTMAQDTNLIPVDRIYSVAQMVPEVTGPATVGSSEPVIVETMPMAGQFQPAGSPCGSPCERPGWLQQQLSGLPGGSRLNGSGLRLGGWLEQGFTWNPDRPDDRFNFPVTFNDRSNEYQMNQFYLFIERPVDWSGCRWDFGGRIDLLYGTDYYFTQATGLELEQDGTQKWNSDHGPRFQSGSGAMYGLAVPQVYAEIYAPIGRGVSVKVGRFYTIVGYEVVPAPGNFFYSHALGFQYGVPFSHTGALADVRITDNFSLQAGATFGWDSFTNPDDQIDMLGGLRWTSCDQRSSLAYAFHVGDEFDGIRRDDTRFIQSLVLTRQIGCRLTIVLESDHGYEQNGGPVGGGDADWYGVNGRFIYKLNNCVSAGLRAEWFRDEDNARIVPVGRLGQGGNYYEVTAGLNIRPFEHLLLRPEARWDWSDVDLRNLGAVGPYDDFSDKNQFTLALDAILSF